MLSVKCCNMSDLVLYLYVCVHVLLVVRLAKGERQVLDIFGTFPMLNRLNVTLPNLIDV